MNARTVLVEALGHDEWCDYADKVPEGCTDDFGCGVWSRADRLVAALDAAGLLNSEDRA